MTRGHDMVMTPADILSSSAGFDEFQKSICSLKGNFPFESEDMQQLGRVYFLRFPDTSDDRNMDNIRMGYRIVRTCILEKILDGIDNRYRDSVRRMLDDLSVMDATLDTLIERAGPEEVESIMYTIERNLDRVRGVIEEIPRGMTKERFIGGISKFYNGMYLLNEAMKRFRGAVL